MEVRGDVCSADYESSGFIGFGCTPCNFSCNATAYYWWNYCESQDGACIFRLMFEIGATQDAPFCDCMLNMAGWCNSSTVCIYSPNTWSSSNMECQYGVEMIDIVCVCQYQSTSGKWAAWLSNQPGKTCGRGYTCLTGCENALMVGSFTCDMCFGY